MRYAVIIPACNEAECIASVLAELRTHLPADRFLLAVGVNACTDATASIARECGAAVAETQLRGYGFGCQAAIGAAEALWTDIAGFIFVAADGANHPADIAKLVAEFERGVPMVLGCRTTAVENLGTMGVKYMLANRVLGLVCGVLTGRVFKDLGPLRLIDRELFHSLDLRELTYGWTIEAQVMAARLAVQVVEVPVRERRRLAGEQKVSRVSWSRTFRVGCAIFAAGIRTRLRPIESEETRLAALNAPTPVESFAAPVPPVN